MTTVQRPDTTSRATRTQRWAWPAAVAIAMVPALVKLIAYPSYPGSDDSFIHLAVIQNIVSGAGWGVSPGQPVNLSSSPAYTGLLLALHPFGGIGLAQIASVACVVAGLLFLYATARSITQSVPLALTALAIAAANAQMWRWTGTVMETTLGFGFAAAIIYATYRARSTRSYLVLGLLIGVATLVRFELGMMLPLAAAHLWTTAGRTRPAALRTGWLLPGFAVGVAPWVVFSLAYFGTPIPTTFGAKTSGLLLVNSSVGAAIASTVATAFAPALFLAAVALVLVTRAGKLGQVIGANLVVFLWPVALFAFYYLKTPYLQSPGRYTLPGMAAIPLAVVLLVAAVPQLRRTSVLAGTAVLSLVAGLAVNLVAIAPTLQGFNDNYRTAMVAASDYLRENCDGSGPVLVWADIGIVSAQGTGSCRLADAGTLASPELRGMTIDQMIDAQRPQFVIESIGSSSGAFAVEHSRLRLVYSRPYQSHGLTTAGQLEWLNIFTVAGN